MSFFSGFGAKISKTVGSTAKSVQDTVDTKTKEATAAADETAKTVVAAVDEKAKAASAAVGSALSSFTGSVEEKGKAADESMKSAATAADTKAKSAASSAGAAVDSTAKAVDQKAKDASHAVDSAAKSAAAAADEKARAAAKATEDAAKKVGDKTTSAMASADAKAKSAAKSAGSAMSSVGQTIDTKAKAAGTAIGSAASAVDKKVTSGMMAVDKQLSALLDNFKTGTVLQLVSRSSGKSLQLVDGSVNGLGSPEADAPENTHLTIVGEGLRVIRVHNGNDFLCIESGSTSVKTYEDHSKAGPETRFKIHQVDNFVTLESASEPNCHVGIQGDGSLKSALVVTSKDSEAQFGVRVISTP